MKDLTSVFECEAEAKREEDAENRRQAVAAAKRCCVESTPEEWLSSPYGLRLPLQPGLWLAYDSAFNNYFHDLYLERVKRNRRGKSRGTERSYINIGSSSALAEQLRGWGYA